MIDRRKKFERSKYIVAFGIEGSIYGELYGCGKDFLRMNIVCPRSCLADGLSRLKAALSDL